MCRLNELNNLMVLLLIYETWIGQDSVWSNYLISLAATLKATSVKKIEEDYLSNLIFG